MTEKSDFITMFNKLISEFYDLINRKEFELALGKLEEYSRKTKDELSIAGCYIDLGSHSANLKLIEKGIKLYIDVLAGNHNLQEAHKQAFTYNIGNGYNSLFQIKRGVAGDAYKAFVHNEDLLKAAEYYKQSIELGNSEPSIYTNLGNLLDVQGRNIEAITYYDKALKIDPQWGMALGNKAISIISLARISGKYQEAQYIYAYQLLKKAIGLRDSVIRIGGTQALEHFQKEIKSVEELFRTNKLVLEIELKHKKFNVESVNKYLQSFYEISIENDLFLNLHIQDKTCEAALVDHVFISLVTPARDNTTFFKFANWINEIKESYMTGRYLLVESLIRSRNKSHISKLTDLIYPLDYSTKTIYTGLLKSSIKESFSILDKMAYFFDEYLELEIVNKEKINWQNFWFRDLKATKPSSWFIDDCPFHHKIMNIENYSLFAVFSLFLDIRESGLAELRHLLTHKKIHVMVEGNSNDKDTYTEEDLTEKAILLLQLTKYAIIYLINFVNSQENLKRESGKLIVPMYAITDQFI